jgi:hypothetical protein
MHTPSTRRSFLRTSGTAAAAVAVGVMTPAAASALGGTAIDGLATDRATARSSQVLQLARVWVTRDTSHLLGTFDDTHNVFDDGSVEILLWPGDLARLVQTGLRFEITVADLVARDRAAEAASAGRPPGLRTQPGETTTGNYRTLVDHNADLQRLAADNPGICRLIELPFLSLQGRTVYGIEIAEDVTRTDGRPVYYNDGVHHAREWPAAEMPIMWAFDLVDSYNRATGNLDKVYGSTDADPQDARMLQIVQKTRNIIVPIVNPDGFDYSRTGPAGTGRDVFDSGNTGVLNAAGLGMQYWRKNMRSAVPALNLGVESAVPNNGVVPVTPGALGVDCNRNYSYRWGGGGSSATQNGETYRGPEPFSEPESRNVQWVHQTWQCVSGITHHTSGNLVLWAWGDTHDDAPDDVLLARLGFACGDYNKYRPTKSIDLYVTTGTCSDYTYGTFGSISYTFEHAGSSFHPPYAEVVPQFYANNREALMMMIEFVCLDPGDRSHLAAAIDAFGEPRRGPDTLATHLFGSFQETITGTDYDYLTAPGLDLAERYNCVIQGRLVDGDGNPVAGTVTNTKSFANPLSAGNPIGEPSWPDLWSSTIQTAPDGTFRWVVYPTTAPAVEFEGGQEGVTLTFESGALQAELGDVVVRRGEVRDLGDITLA